MDGRSQTLPDDSSRTLWSVPANGTSGPDITWLIYSCSFNHAAVSVSRNTTGNPGNRCSQQTGPTGDQILIGMELLPEWVGGLICCLSLDPASVDQLLLCVLRLLPFHLLHQLWRLFRVGQAGFMDHRVTVTSKKTRWGRRTCMCERFRRRVWGLIPPPVMRFYFNKVQSQALLLCSRVVPDT